MDDQDQARADDRTIRVFISSTFRDMIEERNELMTHVWPALRELCQERQVELVEVDLRWGIAESQSTRRETLKLCLDEIHACRPFFIGLLGERYGWTPGDDAFTADLQEEQPWLAALRDKSVTELEILHGVLNNPDMAGRAFFYFRDPAWAQGRGPDFVSETAADVDKQAALKTLIRTACEATSIPLRENYPDPEQLAAMVRADLTAAIKAQFPEEEVPDPLTREARDHEAFAEIRRRTYIGRADYFETLDNHAVGDGGPLLLLGDSGSGKSALLANWLSMWRENHPGDFILQHYIGGTADSADHWRLMTRVMAEIKHWSGDPEDPPIEHDDILSDFPVWLSKARARAVQEGVRFILVLDALNQLQDQDRARLLGWLPEHPFGGPLRLIVSTLPGLTGTDDPLAVIQERHWQELRVVPLTVPERRQMITDYLARFGKTLDAHRVDRTASAAPAANPLYLKILLDDLRVTGTYDRLDERLGEYLEAADIPTLLQQVLARYQRDYERDRPGLVGEALGLIYAARRGLSETELLELLRPADQEQLPPAHWTPLRAALANALVDRGGILNFSHDHLRTAVGHAFVADAAYRDELRLRLADYFEAQEISARTSDELPWLLKEIKSFERLRSCLLLLDRFLLIDSWEELRHYWVGCLGEQHLMGIGYFESFQRWSAEPERPRLRIASAARTLGWFLYASGHDPEAEQLLRRALSTYEQCSERKHTEVLGVAASLASVLSANNQLAEAEQMLRRVLDTYGQSRGKESPEVFRVLEALTWVLVITHRFADAEPLVRRTLRVAEQNFGPAHPWVSSALGSLAALLLATQRPAEAEPLLGRLLANAELSFGSNHPDVASVLEQLAELHKIANRDAEALPLLRRALAIEEACLGRDHPDVASRLETLAIGLMRMDQFAEAERLLWRSLAIFERTLGGNHHQVARALQYLAKSLFSTDRFEEAEPLMRRSLAIRESQNESDHPAVASGLSDLATLLNKTGRPGEALPLLRRTLDILESSFGDDHSDTRRTRAKLIRVLRANDQPAEAETLMRRTLELGGYNFGLTDPELATYLGFLASLLTDANQPEEQEPLIRRTFETLIRVRNATGHHDPRLRWVVDSYAKVLHDLGQSPDEITATLREIDPDMSDGLHLIE